VEALLGGDIAVSFLSNPLFFTVTAVGAAVILFRLFFGRTIRVITSNREKLFLGAVVLLLITVNWLFLILDGR